MTIKELDEKLEEGQSLKAIAQAYSEIANLKIKKIRSAVERNRLFFDEISQIYGIVRNFALKKKVVFKKPKNRLSILLTSNYRFYGNINSSLINYFLGLSRELKDVDKIILGKDGIDFFKAAKLLPGYQEFLLKSDVPQSRELAGLASICAEYNQVLVFHTKFKSLLMQQATFTDITATSLYLRESVKAYDTKKTGKDLLRFIFEPDLPKILKFFDSQIITLLLEQTFLESELSRTASRFISMDQAETKSNQVIKEYQTLRAYVKRNMDNNTILENFATMMAVKKHD